MIIRHKKFGEGTITENNGSTVTVQFANAGEKQLGMVVAAAKGLISAESEAYVKTIEIYGEYLKKEDSIRNAVRYAEMELVPYSEYVE